MKSLNNIDDTCWECTGAGCKVCNGTGHLSKEDHILWLQKVIERKLREIEEIDEQIDLQHQLIKSLKKQLSQPRPLTPETVIELAKQDKLI